MTTYVQSLATESTTPLDHEREFARRVADSQRRVVAIAVSVLGNPQDAEEVAQDAFVRAYRSFESLKAPEKFRAWINRIVFRLALNRRRARARRLARDTAWHDEREASAPTAPASVERLHLDDVRAAIEGLPEKLRLVILLCAVEDMEAAEVAAILRIPVGTVRSRLHLARKKLLERVSS